MSKRQLMEVDLLQNVGRVLAAAALPPSALQIEVTESLIMDRPEEVIPRLQDLRNLGVGLSMDDFGTGHSSLTWLNRFPIDILKIDRGFVMELGQSTTYTAIVQAIITLAANLRMRVTAEGVETNEQLAQIQPSIATRRRATCSPGR